MLFYIFDQAFSALHITNSIGFPSSLHRRINVEEMQHPPRIACSDVRARGNPSLSRARKPVKMGAQKDAQ
jgi:hypothetical protein